jgi:hypothetical protein
MLCGFEQWLAAGRKRHLVKAGSVVGLAAVLSAGLSSAGLASSGTPTVLPTVYYACVNHTTHAWQYSTSTATCPTGFVKEHWNQTGPVGPPGPRGPSDGFHATSDGVSMAVYTTIVSLSIPTGNYLIYAKGVPYFDNTSTSATSDSMHCDLVDTGGNTIDETFAVLILATDSFGGTYSDQSVGMMAPTVTTGGTISFACFDDRGVGIMYWNQLTAIQLGAVTGLSAPANQLSHDRNRP